MRTLLFFGLLVATGFVAAEAAQVSGATVAVDANRLDYRIEWKTEPAGAPVTH